MMQILYIINLQYETSILGLHVPQRSTDSLRTEISTTVMRHGFGEDFSDCLWLAGTLHVPWFFLRFIILEGVEQAAQFKK